MAGKLLDIGACIVEFDTGGTPVILTPSLGGVKVMDSLETAEVKEDGQGDAPVGNVTKGRVVKVEVPATRSTMAQLNQILFGSALGTDALVVSNEVGNDLADSAVVVTIKPLINNVASTDKKTWIQFPSCSPPIEKFELGYDSENQRVFQFEMQPYPDATGEMVHYGVETV